MTENNCLCDSIGDPPCPMHDPPPPFNAADERYQEAAKAFMNASSTFAVEVQRVIDRMILAVYPKATLVIVDGFINEDENEVVRVQAIWAGAVSTTEGGKWVAEELLADWEDLHTSEFDELTDEVDCFFEELGSLTGGDYFGYGKAYLITPANKDS